MNFNKQIDAYIEQLELKQQQLELIELICNNENHFEGSFLDIGCSNGIFLQAISKIYPKAKFTGFDISEKLIKIASANLTGNNINFIVADIEKFNPVDKFDIITASGILSIYDDFVPILDKWLSWLNTNGKLYIFGRFNSHDIDTKIYFRNNFTGGDWENGLTSYSLKTVSKFLDEKKLNYQFKKFFLEIDLPEREDPIRTYTLDTTDGTKLVVNGANIIAEHFHLIINKFERI